MENSGSRKGIFPVKIVDLKQLLRSTGFVQFIFIMVLNSTVICQDYQAPIGIPNPDFGIEETVENIYGAGYYTYYIDNTDTNATDVDNQYGTREKPRKTIPTRMLFLPPGTVIEIYGGPYSLGSYPLWAGIGTAEQPVFIRGGDPNNKPAIINANLETGGSYIILENLELYNNSRLTISFSTPDHVAIRNCEIYNPEDQFISYGSAIHASGEDIVIYNNHIHHHWREDDTDCHGVVPAAGARRVWVLDNHIHHNSGDAFQATHGASDNPARYVYVGRNIMHDDRENGVDLKYVQDIVISQNTLYGYKDASTSDGSAMVLGSDGMPNRVWILFNDIYDSRNGIRNEETDQAWLIGNQIHNIEGFAIALEKKSDDLYIIGNTIYDVNLAIDHFGRDDFRLHIFNNIFAKVRNSIRHLDIQTQSVADVSEMSHNLFWQEDSGAFIIRWGSENQKSYLTTSDFDGFAGGSNNIIGDPLFKDAMNSVFSLEESSAAIDAGIFHEVYDTFYNKFGLDIKVDFTGAFRPQFSDWDLGAYEYIDITGISEATQSIPNAIDLTNYPNPFNPKTIINYELPIANNIDLSIFNIFGQKVLTLISEKQLAGKHQVEWDASGWQAVLIFTS